MIHVLVTDESPDIREIIEGMLSDGLDVDHQVLHASSLSESIQVLGNSRVDVILVSLELPDSSGIDTLIALRAHALTHPILVIADDASPEMGVRAVQCGAQDYFPKRFMNPVALARVVRFTIERSRRESLEQELVAAEQVQAALYPKSPPAVRGIDLSGAVWSAGTGCGDYFDFLSLTSGEIGLVLGDVSGHGMAAALRMVETRACLRALVRYESDVGVILSRLNQCLMDSHSDDETISRFVTLLLATIDPRDGKLHFASAGHPAYIIPADGNTRRLTGKGLPLGMADMDYETTGPVQLERGDTVLIVSDGIEETMNSAGEQFGIDRVMSKVRKCQYLSAGDTLCELRTAAREFAGGVVQRDDMTGIIARIGQLAHECDGDATVQRHPSTIQGS